MTDKTENKNENNTSSGGLSRASKKRAKKRRQKEQEIQNQKPNLKENDGQNKNDDGGEGIISHNDSNVDAGGITQKQTSQLLMSDDDAKIKNPKNSEMKKRKKKPKAQSSLNDGMEQMQTTKKAKKCDGDSDGDADSQMETSDEKLKENNTMSEINEGTTSKDDDGEESDDNAVEEEFLIQFLSQLSPIEILYPERCINPGPEEEEESNTDDTSQQHPPQPSPYELMQTVTTTMRSNILFRSILSPSGITPEVFYKEYWENKPLLISKSENRMDQNKKEGSDGKPPKDANSAKRRRQRQQEDTSKSSNQNNKNEEASVEEMRQYRRRFDGIISKKDIEGLISHNAMRYGKDLNVTNYCSADDGVRNSIKRRITLDQLPSGSQGQDGGNGDEEFIIAESNDVWSNFSKGCTVRLLCPHKHIDPVHTLLSTLEDEIGCMVGSNVYLTPGGSGGSKQQNQGFAPHYDDIEAFILQLEGYKRWRVYAPMSKRETLPRESSRDFNTEDDAKMMGDPVIDVDLGPGDMLYMPRGWIHQASTIRRQKSSGESDGKDHRHSLHLTASSMQHWSWADLLEMIMPEALEAVAASETTSSLRTGLPRNFLEYMGTMHERNAGGDELPEGLKQIASKVKDNDSKPKTKDSKELEDDQKEILQNAFKVEAKKKMMRVFKQALSMLTWGCDEMGKRHISDRLPPSLTTVEASLTHENREGNGGMIWPNTMVRLARPGIARLVIEDGDGDGNRTVDSRKAVIYHSIDNSRVYHEHPLSPIEFEIDDAPALEMLITTVEPHWVCVRDLIHGDIEDKMGVAQSLYDEGILAIFQKDNPDTTVQTG